MATINWQANGSTEHFTADFGLVDSKGRRVGAFVCVERNIRFDCGVTVDEGTFGTRIQSLRDGQTFGASAGRFGDYATIEEAKAAAEAKAERSCKAAAKKYGATVEEAKAKVAADYERAMAIHRAKLAETDAWLAARKAEQAAKAEPVAAPAPAVVEAPAVEAPAAEWQQADVGADRRRVAQLDVDLELVDAKGRRIGTFATVQRNEVTTSAYGGETTIDFRTFSYSIIATRNGSGFGPIPRETGRFSTVEEAKVAAEKAVERSRKAQARRYGASVEEAQAAVAARKAKHREAMARWWAEHGGTTPPPAVEAPVAEVAIEVEVDPEVARFRGVRGPDGELRFRKVEPARVELPRCRNCGVAFDPAVEGVADVFVACGPCRHGQLEPGEAPDCACHRDPTLFA